MKQIIFLIRKEKRMQMQLSKKIVSIALGTLLISGLSANAALADTQSQEAKAQYRSQITAFKTANTAYKEARASIKATFANAKASALATKNAALSAATTEEQKIQARTAFKEAIAQAKATRDQALAALGAKPVKPARPS